MTNQVTEQELAEWEARANETHWQEDLRSECLRLIAALREARAKNDRLLKIGRELEDEAESRNEYIGELQAKLAAIREVVANFEENSGMDPQYMLLRALHEVIRDE